MISIVTPVFNGAAHIGRTLESLTVQKASFEHVIMDACSSDNTVAQAQAYSERYPVRIHSERDAGLYDAVQKGFARSEGDILAWLNAGDAYLPWTLHTVQKVFDAYPEVEWITGVPGIYLEEQAFFCAANYTPIYIQRLIRNGWHNGHHLAVLQQESMFWRRSLWERSNGAQVLAGNGRGKGLASDYHLWRRFAAFAPLCTVCSPLASFTVTPGQLSQQQRVAYFADMGVIESQYVPNRWLMLMFRLYSSLCLGRCIHLDTLPQPSHNRSGP